MSPGSAADPAALDDPLAAQLVARQMETLLSEKSKLVAKNDQLLRENTALQVGMGGRVSRGGRCGMSSVGLGQQVCTVRCTRDRSCVCYASPRARSPS